MADDALCRLGLADLAAAIRQREVSPVEVVEAHLARIEAQDGRLHAFVRLEADAALAAAREAEQAVVDGRALGAMHGVPYALKDIVDAEGLPTTCQSRLYRDHVADRDAFVTARLRAAGGILMGKLTTHEFAIGGPCFDLPDPPARNPWNPDKFTGGSSSGSGAAVAAGFVPFAIGTDTGGSVRNPATCCGLAGLKPTYGRVSRRGVFPLSFSLDHVGPMTRSIADNALALGLIAGHDPDDPASARRPVPDFAQVLEAGVAGLRLGVVRHFHRRDLIADAEVEAGFEATVAKLAEAGADIVEVETAPLGAFANCNRVILLAEAAAVHERHFRERPEAFGDLTRRRLLPGLFLSAVDYVQAQRERRRLTAAMDAALEGVDALLCVSAMDPPCDVENAQEIERTYPRQARTPFNVTGHPALSVPAGFTAGGLPLALQIVAPAWQEALAYRIGAEVERACDAVARWPEPAVA